MIQFIIDGETPAKKNSRINTRSGRSFPSKRYQQWHDVARLQVQSQMRQLDKPIDYPCIVSITFVHGDLVRRDSDNATSSILDLLMDCKVLKDDAWTIVRKIAIDNLYEKKNPRAIVNIEVLK